MTVNQILTAAGRRWLSKFKLNDAQLTEFCARAGNEGGASSLRHNCGGSEIVTEDTRWTLPRLLAEMVSRLPLYEGSGGSSLFVATWNNQQPDNTALFKKAGFTNFTRWVTNPNTNNKIKGAMCTLNPNYRRQKKDRDRWGGW